MKRIIIGFLLLDLAILAIVFNLGRHYEHTHLRNQLIADGAVGIAGNPLSIPAVNHGVIRESVSK